MLINKIILFVGILSSFILSQYEFNYNYNISPTSIQQSFPDIEIDENGDIHVVWVEQTGNAKNVYYSYSSDLGLSFSEKVQVNSVNGHVVAFSGAGPRIRSYNDKIYVLWADSRNGYNNTSIYLTRTSNNGQNWINDFEVSDQPHFQLYGDMEIDSLGVLHLTYYNYQSNLHFSDIRYTKLHLNGMMLEESVALGVTTEIAEPCDCCSPDIEVTPNGDVFIAYRNNINNIRDHYITKKMANETEFSQSLPIADLNDMIGFCPSSSPSITIQGEMIGSGAMHYNGEGVFLTFGNTDDLQFHDVIYVEPYSSINNYPKVVLNNSEIYAIWVDATNKEILFTNLNESDSLSNESQNILITDENITQVAEPKLVIHDDNLFTVWTDNRTGVNNVYFSSTQELDIIAGDVNMDEFINVLDILMVVNHIIGHQGFNVSQLLAADLNNDNMINILDVIQIINIILSVN